MSLQFECAVCGVKKQGGGSVNTRFGCSWVCGDCFNLLIVEKDEITIKILNTKQRATVEMLYHDWITNKNPV